MYQVTEKAFEKGLNLLTKTGSEYIAALRTLTGQAFWLALHTGAVTPVNAAIKAASVGGKARLLVAVYREAGLPYGRTKTGFGGRANSKAKKALLAKDDDGREVWEAAFEAAFDAAIERAKALPEKKAEKVFDPERAMSRFEKLAAELLSAGLQVEDLKVLVERAAAE